MAGATEQDIFEAIFGSGFDQYSWWIGYKLVSGEYDESYTVPDGWVLLVAIEDPENDGMIKKEVSATTIREVCQKILADSSYRQSLRDECAHLLYVADMLDMDCEDADTVMQYVMFNGEVVYG
jgi:hypothetical protein